ncbi:MAG TPA: hypothetical protein VG295_00170 [Solirubrobacteraceae bacterium]|nr:hypothetical protein [Solirubrobacteraceae bacterium]
MTRRPAFLLLACSALALLVSGVGWSVASADRAHAPGPGARLRFGVYPWAAAGAVNHVKRAVAENPAKALAAVRALKGSRSLVVRLYGQYTGADRGETRALLSDAGWWSRHGVEVEMVLRYRPALPSLASGYVPWVRTVATRLARLRGLVAIQIANEVNNRMSASAADGVYAGAVAALVHAVPAARRAVIAAGRPDVKIGFNWAAGRWPCRGQAFWSALRRAGGRAFTSAVGWVGIDIYPGTWSPPSPSVAPTFGLIDTSVTDGIRCLRTEHMPAAGLSRAVTITVAETGYPTDASRSEITQAIVLTSIIASVESLSAVYGITDLQWFSMRDANTASGQLENGYGLLRDNYRSKLAFVIYQAIIAAAGA